MKRAIIFAPLARLEFEDAAAWYEEQLPGLGDKFRIEVNASLQQVLKSPERLLAKLRKRYSHDCPTVVITTGNIAFLPLRASLLSAGFHYGRRGILDMDHTRLFTFSSLVRTLQLNGYEVISKRGLPAPFPLAVGNGLLAKFLLLVNCFLIKISKSIFSYQIAVVAKPLPTLEHLLEDAFNARRQKLVTGNNES